MLDGKSEGGRGAWREAIFSSIRSTEIFQVLQRGQRVMLTLPRRHHIYMCPCDKRLSVYVLVQKGRCLYKSLPAETKPIYYVARIRGSELAELLQSGYDGLVTYVIKNAFARFGWFSEAQIEIHWND